MRSADFNADFNKDGRPDVVTTGQNINALSLLLSDGKGGFRKASGSPFPAGAAPRASTAHDINRDGNPDVVVIPYHRDLRDLKQLGVTVLLGDGTRQKRPTTISNTPSWSPSPRL